MRVFPPCQYLAVYAKFFFFCTFRRTIYSNYTLCNSGATLKGIGAKCELEHKERGVDEGMNPPHIPNKIIHIKFVM